MASTIADGLVYWPNKAGNAPSAARPRLRGTLIMSTLEDGLRSLPSSVPSMLEECYAGIATGILCDPI